MTAKKKATPLRTLGKRCDVHFSLIVRARGYCESGRREHKGNLQCAHGFSRSYRVLRWDQDNAFCFCAGCHVFYTLRPIEWELWLRAKWGDEKYDLMQMEALYGDVPDVRELAPKLVAEWKALEAAA